MQFKNDYFFFEGIDSRNKDIYIITTNSNSTEYDFGLTRSVQTEESVGDVPTFIKVKEETFDIELQISKCDKGGRPISFTQEDLVELNRWLVLKNPRPLYIDDLVFYVIAKKGKKWLNYNDQGYLTLTFESVSPFAYAPIKTEVFEVDDSGYELVLENHSPISEYEYVDIELTKITGTYIEIINHDLAETFKLENLDEEDIKIKVYGEGMKYVENIKNKEKNMRPKVSNANWLRLIYGVNNIEIKTDGNFYVQMLYQEKNPLI